MVRKNQYCENGHTAQCYPHQAAIDLLQSWKKPLHMEPTENPYSEEGPKQKEQSGRHHAT